MRKLDKKWRKTGQEWSEEEKMDKKGTKRRKMDKNGQEWPEKDKNR